MTKKTETKTNAGKTTVWLCSNNFTPSIRITLFEMSPKETKKTGCQGSRLTLEVELFDDRVLEWKELVRWGDFSEAEIKDMIKRDSVLTDVRDYLRCFFRIDA